MRRCVVVCGHASSQFGITVLMAATLFGCKDAVELLVDRGADPEAKNSVKPRSLPSLQSH